MLRLYLRLIFNGVFLNFFTNCKKLCFSFIKPALYRKKIKKVIEINKLKLSKKQDIINLINKPQHTKSINFVR